MSNMTDRYQPIRDALAMGPTPGPWSCDLEETGVEVFGADGRWLMHMDRGADELRANARLIAACNPDTIRALLEERDALRKEVDEAIAILERMKQ